MLLTASDIAARTNYLNARQTLRRLLDWRVVPVVNENDTTATDEITFGDNDFLSAQVAILLEARLLVLLTDIAGLHTADPRVRPGRAELVEEVRDFAELERLRDRRPHLGLRLRRDAQQGRGRGDGERGGDPGRDLRRHGGRDACWRRRAASAVGTRFAAHRRAHLELQALAPLREAGPRARSWSTRARRGCCARAARACCRSGSPRSRASSRPATRSRSSCDGEVVGKGIVNYSAAELGRIKGLKIGRGPRADAARLRGGGAPRPLRADLGAPGRGSSPSSS